MSVTLLAICSFSTLILLSFTNKMVCNLLWNNFHFNTVSDSFSNKLFQYTNLLSFNTGPPVKFLIFITLVVQEINFVLQE